MFFVQLASINASWVKTEYALVVKWFISKKAAIKHKTLRRKGLFIYNRLKLLYKCKVCQKSFTLA
jgi:hypothetical protein